MKNLPHDSPQSKPGRSQIDPAPVVEAASSALSSCPLCGAPLAAPAVREDKRIYCYPTCRSWAVTEARDLAAALHAAGKSPWLISMAVLALLGRAGVVKPCAQDLVRQVPGLEGYSVLDDFQARARRVEAGHCDAPTAFEVQGGA